ncbi:tyrosine-type recombinase/integrase [Bradyrhizobium sp. AUGA SZCCT0240]|uniref:tyrosine-type recombinase/integrase n=1 Tax=unclassified Bradyrhizobium TaxID=2631580 RepID=UPI001BA99FC6|nr:MULTISPECIES: tyrosine-type recombinase/integrase [unclassified Bradyrhizobium]MBR1196623.1 tyrosine-type recombinase/integrase [Bradyrhizobium sp. AUGA SZCCT0158]MBR1242372.1 tyrosine-type recombinase/integrase [Bradyrhizobium sp. AUGA SZCCT0274]MBR1257151.1 tyrosine-type recombinase/integrase [Bradyrhizobium sp. AUGA SZCCT0240]
MRYPKYTHGFIDHDGKPRFYLRAPGRKRVPLPGLPWSPEFMEARQRALDGDWVVPQLGVSRTRAGTVNAAIVSYYGSTAFKEGLAEGTRKSRRAILERFREQYGDKRIAQLHKAALQTILNKRSAASAKNWRKAIRGFLDHCLSLDKIAIDPLIGVKLVKTKSKPHRPWTDGDIKKYEARHPAGTKARLAMELLLSTGQARCDVVRMGRQFIHGEVLSMSRQKTGVAFDIPVLPPLRKELELQPQADRHLAFLVTEQGKSFSAAGFGNWFADRCREADVPGRAHGLRSAAATRLADYGATTHQLMSWFGWRTIGEAQRYTEAANRKKLAAEAGKLITGTGIGKPETPFAKIETK